MDAELLKKACEVAGLKRRGMWFVLPDSGHETTWFAWQENDPALPAYVASLLVAKVGDDRALHLAYIRQFKGLPPAFMKATDEQRIRAALDVLEGES